jgi:AraC-like DNA-binding protein
VTAWALHYAFRRHYDITPAEYQRRVRLERAHRELQQAEPGDGLTVTEVARTWGWASTERFTGTRDREPEAIAPAGAQVAFAVWVR